METKDKEKNAGLRRIEFSADADNTSLANLTGPLDSNLRQIETILDVAISRRGSLFRVSGESDRARRAVHALQRLLAQVRSTGRELSVQDLQLFFVSEKSEAEGGGSRGAVLKTRRSDLQGRTPRQKDYIDAIQAHDISFAIGPAGTGKTYLAVASAVDAYERNTVERIILCRPAVEAGERLGFLPGDLAQKVDPYLRPLYDALFDLLGFEKTRSLIERQTIEIAPLAYMRGRTLNNAFVILDEAQNTTPEQMKMFLTRIGFGSKAVITGDVTQIDLPRGTKSGLIQAQHVLAGVRGISITYFTAADVVRHPLVARIVEAYEKYSKDHERESPDHD
ncbi:PhoH family protein [Mesosutterella sp. OilRF-GAM-744-9]|uniref:PhoH-like protein n=1 Tax=Mesosutterella porci TaxID=2915351 RepID=A0ABS9MQG6_9BURK|nr:PhoH family protein [Mesosutterella sp. oilRF-744-WT-GAM-9]MCG5030278.1 PhoH family protein [Mesosutterella sp. oilRF-744-WT-GAM-9]MCI6529836.1 PhoH family protein [Mesosutterella sp.]